MEVVAATTDRGRLFGEGPIGIIDIGSNSVRLVLYENMSRAPTVFFNEKVLAGLGRGVSDSGKLQDESIDAALAALRRFKAVAEVVGTRQLIVIATAAARDAENGPEFVAAVEEILGEPIEILSGQQEAELAAAGVQCGFWKPDGVVGDLGGGSLELIDIKGSSLGAGETFPLGGLRLAEEAGGSVRAAQKIAAERLAQSKALARLEGRALYAVGGTWRSVARLHMAQNDYPISTIHHYEIDADEALDFCKSLLTSKLDAADGIAVVSTKRRPLVPMGAAVLAEMLKIGEPAKVVISALGVREGMLYRQLSQAGRSSDPLLLACEELALLRARSPRHSVELIDWTSAIFSGLEMEETETEQRLRSAACLLADIGWRAHPDYRGDQAIAIVANSAFIGIDHPGRGYLALAVYYRYAGLSDGGDMPHIRELVSSRLKARARLVGACFRVAYVISPGQAGVLPRTPITVEGERLVLTLPRDLAGLDGERLRRRLDQLADLGRLSSAIVVAD